MNQQSRTEKPDSHSRLRNETSPYLLQHADNPVNWYPWGQEAFERAKEENKPVFLSIGYSTCHWCHVMAHESFENEKTAEVLNRHFISIKVDREERPDIDSVYMAVCQAFTGSGGWPLSIFMTWDKKPFFAGTYFPPVSRYNMPGFAELLSAIADKWENDQRSLLESAGQVISHLTNSVNRRTKTGGQDIVQTAFQMFSKTYDRINGGFGSAPKFPMAHNLLFLMYYAKQYEDAKALEMVEKTLMQMYRGGIFDHIGYGFSRYSTDSRFLVPHFEKMLYDNALLIMAYTAAFCATDRLVYMEIALKTAEYMMREMMSQEGAFYSAQDADSEGVEGKFYTFQPEEITAVLGEEKGKEFARIYDITEEGNFEGANIPNLLKTDVKSGGSRETLKKLYDYRKTRTKLHLDDKVLTAWNSLAIAAFSMLYRACKDEKYLETAKKCEHFLQKNLCDGSRIFTSWRDGRHSDSGFLEDYAFYAAALLELYHSTLDSSYLERAEKLCEETIKRFTDKENGGFYLCEAKKTELFMNPKETYDGAMPNGNSMMAYNLVRLANLTQKESFAEPAKKQLAFLESELQDYPSGGALFLLAKLLYNNPPARITVVPEKGADLRRLRKQLPFLSDVTIAEQSAEYALLNNKTTYYVCKGHTCFAPSNEMPQGNVTMNSMEGCS